MKMPLSILLMLSFSVSLYAQDLIIKHDGDSILCSIVEISTDNVSFKYPNENLNNIMPASEFKIIKLASGRTIQGRERVLIRGAHDWEKVMTSSDERIASNLEFVGEFKETSVNTMIGRYGNSGKQQINALNELKKTVASFGCHLLIITDGISGAAGSLAWASATVIAKAYKYKDVIEIHPERIVSKKQDIAKFLNNEYYFKSSSVDYQIKYLERFLSFLSDSIKRTKTKEELENLIVSIQLNSIKEYLATSALTNNQQKDITKQCTSVESIYNRHNSKLLMKS